MATSPPIPQVLIARITNTGYILRANAAGLHVLVHHRLGAVAAVPDPALAMITLVPLSRLLGLSAADLRRAFMAEDGAPLLSDGYYAAR